MSTTTTLLSLTKPDGGDPALISVLNANFDVLDAAVTLTGGQTLTNKTLTGPHMTTPVVDSGGLTITAGGLTVTGASQFNTLVTASAGVRVHGDPGAVAGFIGLTDVFGVGNGAATAVQAPAHGTGGGPANPLGIATFVKVYEPGGTTYWIPVMA